MTPDSTAPQADHGAVDVGQRQLGSTYAQALLQAAQGAGQLDVVLGELDSLVDDVLDQRPEIDRLFTSGFILAEEREAFLGRAFTGKASPLFVNFLKVLSRHGRLDCLRSIRRAAHELYDEMKGRVRVRVTSALQLDEAQAKQISDHLRKLLGKEPKLQREVNPALLGGVVLRVGDVVYDGSVATQLQRVREQMKHRSVHEIQSRRDRFSPAAGN